MSSVIKRILFAALAACISVCIISGCTGKNASLESSASSAVLSDEKTVESSVDSTAESSDKAPVPGNIGSEAGTVELSGEDIDISIAVLGEWEYNIGPEYYAFMLSDDGSAVYRSADGSKDVPARWTVESGHIMLRAAGGLESFTYEDDKLIDSYTGREYHRKAVSQN